MSDCEREMNCKRPSNSKFDLQLRRAGGDPTRTNYRWDEEDGEVFNPDHRARSAPNSLVVRNLVGQWPVNVCLSIFVCLSRCFDIPLSVIQCFSLSISLSLSFLLSFFFLSFLLSFFLSFFLLSTRPSKLPSVLPKKNASPSTKRNTISDIETTCKVHLHIVVSKVEWFILDNIKPLNWNAKKIEIRHWIIERIIKEITSGTNRFLWHGRAQLIFSSTRDKNRSRKY